jgi:hypothetical protein
MWWLVPEQLSILLSITITINSVNALLPVKICHHPSYARQKHLCHVHAIIDKSDISGRVAK